MRYIFSITKNNVLGIDNKLAFKIHHDLLYFKMNTYQSTIVMGRKTWDSLPFKPLKNRENYVLSKNKNIEKIHGVHYIDTIDQVSENSWIIGGNEIFQQMFKSGDILYITHINVIIEDSNMLKMVLPKKKFLWKSRLFLVPNKDIQYYFACYKVL